MAKRFQFRLQTVLRVRALREREAKRRAAEKRAELARLDQLDRQTAADIRAQQQALRGLQSGAALNPAELSRGRAWIAHLQRTLAQRQIVRAGLLRELEQRLADWRAARQQLRILEKLRERRWAEYVHDREQAEQAESDELARHLHGSSGEAPALLDAAGQEGGA